MAAVLPIVPNVCKVIIHGTNQGLTFVNSVFMQHSTVTMDQAAMNALASAVNTAYWNAFSSSYTSNLVSVSATAVDLSTRTGFTGIDSTAHTGSATPTQPASAQVACCVSFSIQDRYRGGHPRIYLPVAEATDVVGGRNWNPVFFSGIKTSAQGFHTALNAITGAGAPWQHVAVRYYSNHVLLTNPLVRAVSGTVVHPRVDTMRRRLGKETG